MSLLKRLFVFTLIFFILAGLAGFFAAYKIRQGQRKARQETKAPQEPITIIEGWGINDIASYLDKKGIIRAQDFIASEKNFNASQYPILSSKPVKADLEGFLFPDTYFIPKNSSGTPSGDNAEEVAATIIKKMLSNFSAKFTSEMQAQASKQGFSVYEIVTLASIVEKETGREATTSGSKQQLDEERKIIAGIFYNRLNAGQLLQSDATINFITKKNVPAASATDLAIDSPYNTYKYPGLPPGPICNPSLSSLMAVLNPAKTDYFYFLHKQPSGEPVYSKTFEEHLQNKAKYLK